MCATIQPTKAPAQPQRFLNVDDLASGYVQIRVGKEQATYRIETMATELEGERAFRVTKLSGDGAEYHVRVTSPHGYECECKGFLRHDHCRHGDALLKLLSLGYLPVKPAEETDAAEEPVNDAEPVEMVVAPLDAWAVAFRQGIAPELTDADLAALAQGLRDDDSNLLQGATTSPPPMACVGDWPVEAADAVGYAMWHGRDLTTVGEVEHGFSRVCQAADEALGQAGAVRYFLNWWDSQPRSRARRDLLALVESIQADRADNEEQAYADWQMDGEPVFADEMQPCEV